LVHPLLEWVLLFYYFALLFGSLQFVNLQKEMKKQTNEKRTLFLYGRWSKFKGNAGAPIGYVPILGQCNGQKVACCNRNGMGRIDSCQIARCDGEG
jgi:hypothetical protein